MRKVLLTVMMVSSLLAFNACKKDGAVGPAGPAGANGTAGATGATGSAGAVGAAGAKGADGTKILSGTVDPTTTDPTGSVVGDYFFNKTTKTLWGPKAAAGWAGTNTTLTGPAGNKFLFGAGAPTTTTPTNAVEGDFYFDTNTSTFYGPRDAAGVWASIVPLSSNSGLKNYVFTKGFETIKENVGARLVGQTVVQEYSDFTLNTSYAVSANDMIRIAKYPGWINNREMKVQVTAGTGAHVNVVTYADLSGPTPAVVAGRTFVYTNMPTEQFTLTADDISRLTVTGGTAFNYLTYATAQNITLGTNLVLATKKNLKIVNDPTRISTSYTAETKFDLNTLPGLAAGAVEEIKRDGLLYVKYKYFSPKTATGGNALINVFNANAGWSDLDNWANGYVGVTGGYSTVNNINPFAGAYSTAQDFMTSGNHFGGANAAPFAPSNSATGTMDLLTADRGKFTVNWTIASGSGSATATQNLSDAYYNSTAANLTYTTPTSSTKVAVPASNLITVSAVNNGLEPAALTAIKLVQIQVLAVPAANVAAAKAKGVDVNSSEAFLNFVKL